MKILAVETSCDETAISIVEDGNKVLSNTVSSQIDIHKLFGGVVPEVASRIHIENISIVLKESLESAGCTLDDIDAIAMTQGPGLVGSLHVGIMAAKTLAWFLDKPLIPIHHITGHIYANRFVEEIQYPMLALVVSGGHTELVYLKEEFHFEVLGCTQDDAVGEAYDKVARAMELGYPGGPKLDKLAKLGKKHYPMPKVKTQKDLDFSFSGLKSSVLQTLKRHAEEGIVKEDLAYDFQEAVMRELLEKTKSALNQNDVKHLVLGGGVAANSRLRELILNLKEDYPELLITIPPMWCCTDNAAMIGAVAEIAYRHGVVGTLDVSADPSLAYS